MCSPSWYPECQSSQRAETLPVSLVEEASMCSTKRLEVQDGFRIMNCPHCRWKGRSKHLNCECGKKWFLCETHRVDPAVHKSHRPPKRKREDVDEHEDIKLSDRNAPLVRWNVLADKVRKAKVRKENRHEHLLPTVSRPSPEHPEFLSSA